MKFLNDPAHLESIISRHELLKHLYSLPLNFSRLQYEKGEFITSPDKPIENLTFVVKGSIQIYDISPEGRKIPLTLDTGLTMLGDQEFCHRGSIPFFVETETRTLCVSLPLEASREVLDNDIPFLHALADSLSAKLEDFTRTETRVQTVKEKVLFYMENVYPDGILNGIDSTAVQLRCSRRQLQRVLKELCESGEIKQAGKGKYRLSTRS